MLTYWQMPKQWCDTIRNIDDASICGKCNNEAIESLQHKKRIASICHLKTTFYFFLSPEAYYLVLHPGTVITDFHPMYISFYL